MSRLSLSRAFGAPRGIRTPNRQIRSLVLRVDLVGSRRIWPAQVGCLVDPAEGSVLPAQVISSGIAVRSRAVWLLPTVDFQPALLGARNMPPGPTALYLLLRERIAREASEHGAPTLIVDGSLDLEVTVAAVEERFAPALAEGPRAETPAEWRALLREANQAIVAQVRGYFARPWAEGDAQSVVREFGCECGSTACHASVHVPVAAVMAGAVLAPGHR
jgi:hypothetical protein